MELDEHPGPFQSSLGLHGAGFNELFASQTGAAPPDSAQAKLAVNWDISNKLWAQGNCICRALGKAGLLLLCLAN